MQSKQQNVQQTNPNVDPSVAPSIKQMTNVKSGSLMISHVLVSLVSGAGTSLCIWYIHHRRCEIYQKIYTLEVLF